LLVTTSGFVAQTVAHSHKLFSRFV